MTKIFELPILKSDIFSSVHHTFSGMLHKRIQKELKRLHKKMSCMRADVGLKSHYCTPIPPEMQAFDNAPDASSPLKLQSAGFISPRDSFSLRLSVYLAAQMEQ